MSIELKRALTQNGGHDVEIAYREIARYFPSNSPHPDSFDYKRYDKKALLDWSKTNGWTLKILPAPDSASESPPMLFKKMR